MIFTFPHAKFAQRCSIVPESEEFGKFWEIRIPGNSSDVLENVKIRKLRSGLKDGIFDGKKKARSMASANNSLNDKNVYHDLQKILKRSQQTSESAIRLPKTAPNYSNGRVNYSNWLDSANNREQQGRGVVEIKSWQLD